MLKADITAQSKVPQSQMIRDIGPPEWHIMAVLVEQFSDFYKQLMSCDSGVIFDPLGNIILGPFLRMKVPNCDTIA